MNKLKTFLKWGALILCALIVLLAIAWSISRAMYPTSEQREAIAEMETLPEYDGENAFPLLWSLGYDVPDSELGQVLEEDVRRFSEKPLWPQPRGEEQDAESADDEYPFFDSVRDDYPSLNPSDEDRSMFCGGLDENCLEKVRQDLDGYGAMIERNRAMLDRVERIQEYDYIRSAFPPRQTAPFPSYQNVSYLRTRYAVEFASGNEREAIASVCREIQSWRRLSARADTLIDRSIGMAYSTEHNGLLLAQMLAEWPVDQPLPEPCNSALSPPEPADVSICNAMRGEFQRMAFFNRNLDEHNEGFLGDLILTVLIDAEASIGLDATGLRALCEDSANARVMADRPAPETEPPSVLRFACLGNPYGCISSAISAPALTAYEDATLDHGARLRVLGTLVWMRKHAGEERSPEQLLEARPEALKSPERDIGFGPEGQTLRVGLYRPEYRDESPVDHWSIPLPPALYRESGG